MRNYLQKLLGVKKIVKFFLLNICSNFRVKKICANFCAIICKKFGTANFCANIFANICANFWKKNICANICGKICNKISANFLWILPRKTSIICVTWVKCLKWANFKASKCVGVNGMTNTKCDEVEQGQSMMAWLVQGTDVSLKATTDLRALVPLQA